MHTDWYISFMEAAKLQSLSKAADKLNMTQPAVSKHIRHLEDALGVQLFSRTAGGVSLTEAGRLFHERIAPVVEQIAVIRAELLSDGRSARLVVGCLPSVAASLLPAGLSKDRKDGIPLSVHVKSSSAELMEALSEGACDAVLVDAEYAGKRFWKREIFSEGYMAVIPADHRLAGKRAVTLAELRNESFLFPSPKCDSRRRVVDYFRKVGAEPHILGEADTNDYIFGVVESGSGMTVVPELVSTGAARYDVVALPVTDSSLRRTVCLAARSDKTGQKLYKMLIQRGS